MKGVDNFSGIDMPKRGVNSAIAKSTLRAISPRYIPAIVFSKICSSVTYRNIYTCIINYPQHYNVESITCIVSTILNYDSPAPPD